MSELLFVIKTFLFTVVLVMMMQIKIGDNTLEQQSHSLIQKSAITSWLQEAAAGGVVLIQKGASQVSQFMSEKFGKGREEVKKAGGRLKFEFERSKEAMASRATGAKAKVQETIEDSRIQKAIEDRGE